VKEFRRKILFFRKFFGLSGKFQWGLDFLVPFLSRKKEPAGGNLKVFA
jgi:hypothetical protein